MTHHFGIVCTTAIGHYICNLKCVSLFPRKYMNSPLTMLAYVTYTIKISGVSKWKFGSNALSSMIATTKSNGKKCSN